MDLWQMCPCDATSKQVMDNRRNHLVEFNLQYTEPLYHIDLLNIPIKEIKKKKSKIKSSMKNLQEKMEAELYPEDLTEKIEEEIEMRQINIELIDEFLYNLTQEEE